MKWLFRHIRYDTSRLPRDICVGCAIGIVLCFAYAQAYLSTPAVPLKPPTVDPERVAVEAWISTYAPAWEPLSWSEPVHQIPFLIESREEYERWRNAHPGKLVDLTPDMSRDTQAWFYAELESSGDVVVPEIAIRLRYRAGDGSLKTQIFVIIGDSARPATPEDLLEKTIAALGGQI